MLPFLIVITFRDLTDLCSSLALRWKVWKRTGGGFLPCQPGTCPGRTSLGPDIFRAVDVWQTAKSAPRTPQVWCTSLQHVHSLSSPSLGQIITTATYEVAYYIFSLMWKVAVIARKLEKFYQTVWRHISQSSLCRPHFSYQKVNINIYIYIYIWLFKYNFITCLSWVFNLKEQYWVRVFQNKLMKIIYGYKGQEMTADWRKLHS